MMALLPGVIILSAFIATGNCLQCVKCRAFRGKDCTGDLVTCEGDDTICRTKLSTKESGGATRHMVIKGCASIKETFLSYKKMTLTSYYHVESKDCNTDECNQPPMEPTPKSEEKNGVTCKTCIDSPGLDCETEETTPCTGDMNKCLLLVGDLCYKGEEKITCTTRECTNIQDVAMHPKAKDAGIKTVELSDSI